MPFSKFDYPRNESVLRSTVDKRFTFKYRRNSKKCRRGDFGMGGSDRRKKVVGGVIDTRNDIAVALSVGGPEHDDPIKTVGFLEFANIGAKVLEVGLLIGTRNEVVRASLLVGGNKIRIVNRRQRIAEAGHVRSDLTLEVVI